MKIVIVTSRIPIGDGKQTPYEIKVTYESTVAPMIGDYITIDDLCFKVKDRQHIVKDSQIVEIQCFCICC